MHNLVLFCKSYIKDLDRLKILKESIDKFNADNIPFVIVCPKRDIEIFKSALITHNEKYEIILLTDEEIINKEEQETPGWISQQFVKIKFYQKNLCNFYVILDSDLYFIQNFYIKDFMYDENTPYTSIIEEKKEEYLRIQNYLKRYGKPYSFVCQGQVFSRNLLLDIEENLLKKNNLEFKDLFEISPYEMQWYGEYYMKSMPYKLYPTSNLFRHFWFQNQYNDAIRKGCTQNNFIEQGFLGIHIQNGWVKQKTYKVPLYYLFINTLFKQLRRYFKKLYNFLRKIYQKMR